MLSFLKKVFGDRVEKSVVRNVSLPDDMLGFASFEDVVDENGMVHQKLVFRTDYHPDPSLRVQDFALQNLIASGIKLNEVASLGQNVLTEADFSIDSVEQIKNSK